MCCLMDEHDWKNFVFVSFTVNVKIMSALFVQGSNDQFYFFFISRTTMQEK